MRIAQVAPLHEAVPPRLYGGTERVVSDLTEELVRRGHDVTLFASADSWTRARLVAGCDQALRLNPLCRDPLALHILQLQQVADRLEEFDVVHFHTDYLHFPTTLHWRTPHLTTLHGRLDLAELAPLYRRFDRVPLVSISDAQRRPLPTARWLRTVYHGMPPQRFRPGTGSGGYLAFLGRICPEKRVDRAIEIAKRVGLPLRIAAKVDPADRLYFEREIEPLFDHPLVEYLGEIGDRDKSAFLGDALALLFPIDWPEPFGLVMIEALACATPVVAFAHGSVPEIIEHGKTGWLVDSIDGAVAALQRLTELSRQNCRAEFEARFSVTAMADAYLEVYHDCVERNPARTPPLRGLPAPVGTGADAEHARLHYSAA